ncbi:hypothetical protein ABNG03_05450 [Halorubrum sp. RMP-47]|uniref:Uncharacterized protein n=1 Tax=Halorubrum miltondacostae TaxID=3076378 RepID=A0ABD5M8N3_9EURY
MGIDTPSRVKFIRTEAGEIVVRPIHSVTEWGSGRQNRRAGVGNRSLPGGTCSGQT